MFLLLAATTRDATGGAGLLGSLIAVAMIVMAVMWVLFPILVNNHFNQLRRQQRDANAQLKTMVTAQKEGNALLKWMADRQYAAEVKAEKGNRGR